MKNKIHSFINQIYPRNLYVIITDSASFINQNFINRECSEEISKEDLDSCTAITFRCTYRENGRYGICVVFRKKKYMTVKEIAHEALHVSTGIHKDLEMSMGFNLGEDETCAYITGWAADCINRVKTNNFNYEE